MIIIVEIDCHLAVPTIAVVHSNLGRFFDRALSMAGPAVDDLDKSGDVNGAGDESSDGGSSVHSLQSFGDLVFDESGTDLSDRLDSSPKRVLVRSLLTARHIDASHTTHASTK